MRHCRKTKQPGIIFGLFWFNLPYSQNILLRAQTAAIERNAIFLVLKIATAIPVRQKSALPFSYCGLNAHNEIS